MMSQAVAASSAMGSIIPAIITASIAPIVSSTGATRLSVQSYGASRGGGGPTTHIAEHADDASAAHIAIARSGRTRSIVASGALHETALGGRAWQERDRRRR